MKRSIPKLFGTIVTVILVGGMIFLRARISATSFDFQSSNFTFFWLSGRMILDGENPYNEVQYLAGHETYGIKWHPNNIFPYPLPLAIICVPLGFLSLPAAYISWQVTTLIIVAGTIYILLNHWQEAPQRRLLIPIFSALFFFGPLYLTLHTGSIGALALLSITGAILLFERDKSLLAGMLLSLTMLKPPQGLTILLLAGIWFFARRDWKAIIGVIIGGIVLLLIGLIQDPLWVLKFGGTSQSVMERTLGIHSNIWAFSYLACHGTSPCSTLLGGALGMTLLMIGGFFLWHNQANLTAWESFNIILPISFLSTIYLWSYDQLPYIIPIIWITATLVKKTKSYIYPVIFLILLDIISFFALVKQADSSKDLWSVGTTIFVLGITLWLYLQPTLAVDQDISATY